MIEGTGVFVCGVELRGNDLCMIAEKFTFQFCIFRQYAQDGHGWQGSVTIHGTNVVSCDHLPDAASCASLLTRKVRLLCRAIVELAAEPGDG